MKSALGGIPTGKKSSLWLLPKSFCLLTSCLTSPKENCCSSSRRLRRDSTCYRRSHRPLPAWLETGFMRGPELVSFVTFKSESSMWWVQRYHHFGPALREILELQDVMVSGNGCSQFPTSSCHCYLSTPNPGVLIGTSVLELILLKYLSIYIYITYISWILTCVLCCHTVLIVHIDLFWGFIIHNIVPSTPRTWVIRV